MKHTNIFVQTSVYIDGASMGNDLLKARKRELNLTADVQHDFSRVTLKNLRECFFIWKTVLNRKERLNVSEFDEVFGLMLGDAEAHFSIVSHGMLLSAYEAEAKCDAISVFLSLAAISKVEGRGEIKKRQLILSRLSEMFFVLVESDASDYGLQRDRVTRFFTALVAGLCRLTGRPQPEDKVIFKIVREVFSEAKKSGSSKITRKLVADWLTGSKHGHYFYDTCVDEIVGRGFDEFSGEILSSALFESHAVQQNVDEKAKRRQRGPLWTTSAVSFVNSKTWNRRGSLPCTATCSEALKFLQKNKLKFAPVYQSGPTIDGGQSVESVVASDDLNANVLIPSGPVNSPSPCPYQTIVGVVDYQKLIVSFLTVFSFYNIPLPSQAQNDEKLKAESSYALGKIAKAIVSLGRVWGNMHLHQILKGNVLSVSEDSSILTESTRRNSIDSNINTFADVVDIQRINATIQNVCEPFVHILVDQPLACLLEILSRPSIHRVPIIYDVSRPDAVITFVSELDLLKKLMENEKYVFGDCLWASINALGLIRTDISVVSSDTTTLLTFHKLVAEARDTDAVAVVDSIDGSIISYLQSSDFAHLTKHHDGDGKTIEPEMGDLLLPTLEYYETHNLLICSPEESLIDVIGKFVDSKMKCLMVVDDDNKPIGSIDLSSIFVYLVRIHEPEYLNLKAI